MFYILNRWHKYCFIRLMKREKGVFKMTFKVILLYILFWTILSENKSLESLIIGILLCSIVLFANKNSYIGKTYKKRLIKFNMQIKYWMNYIWILLKEIVVANIHVAAIVLSPSIKISPEVATFTTKLKSDFYRTVLANSITLTPGTLTLEMIGDELTVHCLKKEYVDGLVNSKFEEILLKMEDLIDD